MLWPFDELDGPWATIHTLSNPPLSPVSLSQSSTRVPSEEDHWKPGSQEPTTDGWAAQTEKSRRRQGCSPAARLGQDGNI
jgi:hypothetical protein